MRTTEFLVDRILSGDSQAFSLLYMQWRRPVYEFCRRYLGNAEQACDVLQLTMIRVYKNLNQLEKRHKFSTWIYTIAHNLCRDELRKRKMKMVSHDEFSESNEGMTLLVDDRTPDATASRMDLNRIFQRVLNELPVPQREVIIMKIYQELKFSEIADILQISENTVKARMYSGLKNLRPLLEKWNINEEYIDGM